MKYLDLIPELEEKFPELKGKFSFRLNTMGGGCRIYVNLDNHEIINYLDIRLYNDTVLLAIPKTFLKRKDYTSKYTEKQKTRSCFYKTKSIATCINKELICRGKAKKLEKTPKYKSWKLVTKTGF